MDQDLKTIARALKVDVANSARLSSGYPPRAHGDRLSIPQNLRASRKDDQEQPLTDEDPGSHESD